MATAVKEAGASKRAANEIAVSSAETWWRSRFRAGGALWTHEWKPLLWILAVFLIFYYLPAGNARFDTAVSEALQLTKWYAREHVLLCLVPAFFIAGAISVFVRQDSVLRYLGPKAPKALAYGVASVSGTILAVCSCTVLPLFGGIYANGAGLGPASAFLYSGPAINVLAIIMTARILGLEIGVARAIGAIIFAVVIGIAMHLIFRRAELTRAQQWQLHSGEDEGRALWQTALFFAAMIGVLVFANWGRPDVATGAWYAIYLLKWKIAAAFGVLFAFTLVRYIGMSIFEVAGIALLTAILAIVFPQQPLVAFAAAVIGLSVVASTSEGEAGEWFNASWVFAKQIFPLLFIGILIAGLLLGRPGHEGFIPSAWVAGAVGGNSLAANLFASVAGAFMYFATLTEVPILQGLMGSGMGDGPALALLLAGPALSLPSILVLRSIMGGKRTAVFVLLVVVLSTISGLIYGALS